MVVAAIQPDVPFLTLQFLNGLFHRGDRDLLVSDVAGQVVHHPPAAAQDTEREAQSDQERQQGPGPEQPS